MTKQERELLTEKMLTDASALNDHEIDEIIADDELRLLYDAALQVKAAMALKNYDSDKEWKAFAGKIRRHPRLRVARWAAATAAAVALAAFALSYWPAPDNKPEIIKPSLIATVDTLTMNAKIEIKPEPTPAEQDLIAQTQTLLPETPKISTRKKARAHKPTAEEIQETIIIKQARIDNEVAIAMAQTYITESYVNHLYESNGNYDDFTMTNELISITAQ